LQRCVGSRLVQRFISRLVAVFV